MTVMPSPSSFLLYPFSIISSILPYLSILFVVLYIISSIQSWYRLRHFKGPWLAPFSSLWMAKIAISGRMGLEYYEACKKYGHLTRIGPNELITDDPEIIRHMSGARTTYGRSYWYDGMVLTPDQDNMLSEKDVGVHDRLKAQMAAGYAGKENPSLESDIDAQILSMISLIERQYLSSGSTFRPMDLARMAQYFTLDVITKISYGHAFGYLANNEDVHGYIEIMEKTVPFMNLVYTVPILRGLFGLTWFKKLFGPGIKDENGVGKLMAVARQVVGERYGPKKIERTDMLGSFVRHGLKQRQAEAEVLLQIIAGSDTTATAIRATILHLLAAPHVLTKLRDEIDVTTRTGAATQPVITSAESRRLPYLQACIREGLRMHPPFTGLLLKEVPAGGDTIDGRYIPAGTKVGHCAWGVMRGEGIWGPDAGVFRPERWLEDGEASRKRMEKDLDVVFGSGRWGCAGKSLAYIELDKIFFELFRRFDFAIVNPGNPWKSTNHNLFIQWDMWVRTSRREK